MSSVLIFYNSQNPNLPILRPGMNSLEYRVETSSGSVVTSEASIFLLNNTAKIVVSDIDGTVTKYNKRTMSM